MKHSSVPRATCGVMWVSRGRLLKKGRVKVLSPGQITLVGDLEGSVRFDSQKFLPRRTVFQSTPVPRAMQPQDESHERSETVKSGPEGSRLRSNHLQMRRRVRASSVDVVRGTPAPKERLGFPPERPSHHLALQERSRPLVARQILAGPGPTVV